MAPAPARSQSPGLTRPPGVGALLRDWRQRRRLSQLDLSNEAGISTRHLSFVETGRSRPSADLVLHLARQLDVPLRERNQLLLAAGYAPVYPQRPLDHPDLAPIRDAVQVVLDAAEPYPAAAFDRSWNVVAANLGLQVLIDGVDRALLRPPVNGLRISLHPDGMAPRIANLGQWRRHLLERLSREVPATGDAELEALLDELTGYPGGTVEPEPIPGEEVAIPLRLRTDAGELSFVSVVTTFGTPTDITVAELAVESFYPADERTARVLRERAG